MPAEPIVIDIVSDVVCPWCWVGKRRLEAALASRPEVAVRLRWHPFQLDPAIPPGGLDRRQYLTAKFGGADKVDALHARLTEAGREDGLDFRFDAITRSVNTLDAHRVIGWAGQAGLQTEVTEALMRAYFTEGRDIGDHAVLAAVAEGVGLDRATVLADLASDKDAEAVRAAVARAVAIGVSGVPFFIFANAFAVSGAQGAAVLATAIDRAREHRDAPVPDVLPA